MCHLAVVSAVEVRLLLELCPPQLRSVELTAFSFH